MSTDPQRRGWQNIEIIKYGAVCNDVRSIFAIIIDLLLLDPTKLVRISTCIPADLPILCKFFWECRSSMFKGITSGGEAFLNAQGRSQHLCVNSPDSGIFEACLHRRLFQSLASNKRDTNRIVYLTLKRGNTVILSPTVFK